MHSGGSGGNSPCMLLLPARRHRDQAVPIHPTPRLAAAPLPSRSWNSAIIEFAAQRAIQLPPPLPTAQRAAQGLLSTARCAMKAVTVNVFSSPGQLRQQRCVRVAAQRQAAASVAPAAASAHWQQQQAQAAAPMQPQQQQREAQLQLSRRSLLVVPAGLLALSQLPGAAQAFVVPPPGYRYHEDKLDGYSFFYPEDWQPVTTSGNDVFYRNPFNVEENLFVNVSSPSSSKFKSVEDLGTPQEAAKRTEDQYLEEFMSTRLGVKRTAEVVNAEARTAPDGQLYYDIQTRVQSYASRNQLAVTQQEIEAGVILEWDRRYLAVLGVAGKRLYEFRLQTSSAAYEKDAERLLTIARSFRCRDTTTA